MRTRPLRPLTDDEEAKIQRKIASDPDSPELTDTQLANPMSFTEAMKRHGGRPRSANPKQQVTVRLDAEVIAAMRNSGPGWQTRMNEVLRKGFRVRAG